MAPSQNEEIPRTYSAWLIVASRSAPEPGPDHGAAAAEDGHPADDDSGHDLQLVSRARSRVDGAVVRRPQHAGDARRCPRL